MNYEWIIIDGNNLLHTAGERLCGKASFEHRRWMLARRLTELDPLPAARVTLVYDGSVGGRDEAFNGPPVEVVYTPKASTADALIERMVCEKPKGCRTLVVTSDLMERHTVESAGADVMSCPAFLQEMLRPPENVLQSKLKSTRGKAPPATMGDFFPS